MTTKALWKILKGALCAVALSGTLWAGSARAQVEVVVEPPPDFVATATPVYFEGRPAYWWGNRWYYRDGPRWGYYHDEPGYLRDWRGHHAFAPHYYGRGHFGGYRRR
jgi:hypothetical protein